LERLQDKNKFAIRRWKTMKIQVVGPGCPRCQATEKNVFEACAQMNLAADISHVDMKEIAKLGVIMTPAVIVDGKIVVSGKLPTIEELKKLLCGS
jgi:small redox-active disulfide protein 2